jgi:hypothetical protein
VKTFDRYGSDLFASSPQFSSNRGNSITFVAPRFQWYVTVVDD